MGTTWTDEVDEILASDLAAGFSYLTPAKGVVITPMAPLGIRDREAGTVTLSTSLGLWKKLDRIRRNSGVAVAYHAREHGLTDQPGFVLVQGRASFNPEPDREWLESITPEWDRFLGPRSKGLAGRMLHTYYWERVAITIEVERIVSWPETDASGTPQIYGDTRLAGPKPQKPPKGGTAPREDTAKVAAQVERLPHTLLGWCGADRMPEVVPVTGATATDDGVELEVPAGTVPEGGRRAGLTSHWFKPRMVGQEQRIHTGWVEANGGRVVYSPHTKAGYRLPASKTLMTLGSASLATRMKASRKAGIAR
ncbi:MAG: hypothetical protein QOI31_33 [Solirubrobacterales bacterium]|jgi:hypothetical protein|nr:hypothetical protein [Solirubrobacterales bacterium]